MTNTVPGIKIKFSSSKGQTTAAITHDKTGLTVYNYRNLPMSRDEFRDLVKVHLGELDWDFDIEAYGDNAFLSPYAQATTKLLEAIYDWKSK